MTWRQLLGWVRHLPYDSALAREQDAEAVAWGLHGQLLAVIADLLAVSNWQRTDGKGHPPQPIRRPGLDAADASRHGGPTGMTNDEVMAVLHGYKTGAYAAQRDDIDEG